MTDCVQFPLGESLSQNLTSEDRKRQEHDLVRRDRKKKGNLWEGLDSKLRNSTESIAGKRRRKEKVSENFRFILRTLYTSFKLGVER